MKISKARKQFSKKTFSFLKSTTFAGGKHLPKKLLQIIIKYTLNIASNVRTIKNFMQDDL